MQPQLEQEKESESGMGVDLIGQIAFCAENLHLIDNPESWLRESYIKIGALNLIRNAP